MYCRIKQEEDEVLMIEFTHTIAYPGAVMVHSDNTLVAYAAVMHSRFFHQIAFKAIGNSV